MAIKKKIVTTDKDKAPVKSTRVKKSEPATKKTGTKKIVEKKTAVKKTAVKKTAVKKTAVKKTAVKKPVVKKTTIKDSVDKKVAAKKTILKKDKKTASLQLLDAIVNAAMDKKAENIVSIDLSKLNNFICKYFIVCSANSDVQVKSIAYHIEDQVLKNLREKIWHKEGFENAQWVLLDYADVVVHIFQTPYRDFYKLEELWADAVTTAHKY